MLENSYVDLRDAKKAASNIFYVAPTMHFC